MRDEAMAELRRFNEVIERLRAPGGCPWDRDQTHESLAPFLLEETYEVLEAIEREPDMLREELGDLLLQVVMHSAIAAERRDGGEGFDIGDVAATATAKMIHRHPHVFSDVVVAGPADVVVSWEKLKAVEKHARESVLDGVPKTLPALAYTQSVQKRPARLGFDQMPDFEAALQEVKRALECVVECSHIEKPWQVLEDEWVATDGGFARGAGVADGDALTLATPEVTAAIGELLFSVVGLARRLRVDAEDALRSRANDFAARFRHLEARAAEEGVDIHELDDLQLQARWQATASVCTDLER